MDNDDAFDAIFENALKEFENSDNKDMSSLKNSRFAEAILKNFEKDFKGDLAAFKKKVGIKEDDPPFVQVYKIFQYEKNQKDNR